MTFDQLDQIDERLDNPPKLWTPKGVQGDLDPDECIAEKQVKGIVEEKDFRTGDYGEHPVVIVVRPDKSRVRILGYGTVLGNRLRGVEVGDAVGIKYLGTRPSNTAGMKPYDNYDVVVLRDGRPVGAATKPTSVNKAAQENAFDPETVELLADAIAEATVPNEQPPL